MPETGQAAFLVVANRLPVDRVTGPDGQVAWQPSPGGLVAAMEPVMQRTEGTWVGWSGAPDQAMDPFEADGMRLVPVPLSTAEVADYYEGFSNATLWPLYHDVTAPPQFDRRWWDAYGTVNARFADAAAAEAARGATVWVQDYQLQLVPALLRERRPDLEIGFFNHIPFPGYEIYARLPWRRQVVEGLLGADLLGFQRRDDATNFLRAVRRTVGATTRGSIIELPVSPDDPSAGTGACVTGDADPADVEPDEPGPPSDPPKAVRCLRAAAFPISIDTAAFEALSKRPDVIERAAQIRRDLGDPAVVLLGVDRLDYTKGILHRLRAYGELLDEGRLGPPGTVLIQVASPSRERVEEYQHLRDEVEVVVGRLNGDHSTVGKTAIHYLHQSFDREEMVALYRCADVMLVTPLRDGMNLVAKEYVACHGDLRGALVLSEFTGAADELRQAFMINPYDVDGTKEAILRAVEVTPGEASRRMRALRRRVREADVHHWANTFLGALAMTTASDRS